MRCKICRFWETKARFKLTEKTKFEQMAREGSSLKELSQYLEFCGLKTSRETVRQHLKHMDLDVRRQREAEKEIQKEKKGIGQKLRSFFHKNDLPFEVECKHEITESFFSIADERVYTKCKKCEKILGSADPQDKSRNHREKTLIILEALQK